MARQFRHGWAFNTSITAANFATNAFLDNPLGSGESIGIEVLRFSLSGANRIVMAYCNYNGAGAGSFVQMSHQSVAAGWHVWRGPWVVPPDYTFGLTPVLFTSTIKCTVDYVIR